MTLYIDIASFEFRLFLTVLFALSVGFEREYQGKAAGIKTFITLCVGSYLLGFISSTITEWDPMRLAVGVVTGIGFLGAGALMKDQESGSIEGLTTAAIIWTASAISLGFGLGYVYYAGVVAFVVGAVVLFSGPLGNWVEKLKARKDNDGLHD